MNKNPRVSCIITVFNLQKFIVAALDSVINQSYLNIEIIIVDDCSSDNSGGIIAGYLKNYSDRIKYIRTAENMGVLLSTIEGIKKSTGEILAFLDGDDVWHPKKVSEIVKVFIGSPDFCMVSHNYGFIDEKGGKKEKKDNSQEILNSKSGIELTTIMRKSIFSYYGNVWLGSAYCLRKSGLDLDKFITWVNKLEDARMTYQDHTLATFFLLSNINGQIGYVNEKLLEYRVHSGNYSGAAYEVKTALKLAIKGYNTVKATYSLVSVYPDLQEEKKRQLQKIDTYNYLIGLYRNQKLKSIKFFFSLASNFWTTVEVSKELTRLIFVIMFGPNIFFLLKNRFKQLL